MAMDNWQGIVGNQNFDNPGGCRVIADKENITYHRNQNIGGSE